MDVTLWGKQAGIAASIWPRAVPYFWGVVSSWLDTWEDRQTSQKRSKLRVVGENMQMVGSGRENQSSNSWKATQEKTQSDHAQAKNEASFEDDDILFQPRTTL